MYAPFNGIPILLERISSPKIAGVIWREFALIINVFKSESAAVAGEVRNTLNYIKELIKTLVYISDSVYK